MAFADLAKRHASFIAQHVLGETVDYRPYPGLTFIEIPASILRAPVDVTGEVLSNVVEIYVSKDDVPTVQVGNDAIRLLAKRQPGETPVIWAVEEILEETPGAWRLRCRQ